MFFAIFTESNCHRPAAGWDILKIVSYIVLFSLLSSSPAKQEEEDGEIHCCNNQKIMLTQCLVDLNNILLRTPWVVYIKIALRWFFTWFVCIVGFLKFLIMNHYQGPSCEYEG